MAIPPSWKQRSEMNRSDSRIPPVWYCGGGPTGRTPKGGFAIPLRLKAFGAYGTWQSVAFKDFAVPGLSVFIAGRQLARSRQAGNV